MRMNTNEFFSRSCGVCLFFYFFFITTKKKLLPPLSSSKALRGKDRRTARDERPSRPARIFSQFDILSRYLCVRILLQSICFFFGNILGNSLFTVYLFFLFRGWEMNLYKGLFRAIAAQRKARKNPTQGIYEFFNL